MDKVVATNKSGNVLFKFYDTLGPVRNLIECRERQSATSGLVPYTGTFCKPLGSMLDALMQTV